MVKINGTESDAAGKTLAELLASADYDSKRIAIERNGNIVPKAQYAETVLMGGACLLQLREKDKTTRKYIDLAEKVHAVAKRYNVPLIIDDRVDVALAVNAYEQGADYLGVGAIYPTTTKVKTVITSTDTLRDICKAVPIPVNAIGGLNKDNIDILAGIPIAGICVVSAIMKAGNPKTAAAELKEKIEELYIF